MHSNTKTLQGSGSGYHQPMGGILGFPPRQQNNLEVVSQKEALTPSVRAPSSFLAPDAPTAASPATPSPSTLHLEEHELRDN